jgi:uridylate kinase
MPKTYVISVGGSLIVPAGGVNVAWLKKFRAFILGAAKSGKRFFLIAGGGVTARAYQAAAKQVAAVAPVSGDWLGISATRLNAQLLKTIFGSFAYPEIIVNPTKSIKARKKIIIAGGYKPGWSTDYDAVLIAKKAGLKTVINLSNIDYVFDKDPKKYPDAKKLTKVGWPEFRNIVGYTWRPGMNLPFDPVASRLAAKEKIRVIVINGFKLANFKACLNGKKFKGTVIG